MNLFILRERYLQNKIVRSEKVFKLSEESFLAGNIQFLKQIKNCVHASVLISRFVCFLFGLGLTKQQFVATKCLTLTYLVLINKKNSIVTKFVQCNM